MIGIGTPINHSSIERMGVAVDQRIKGSPNKAPSINGM
jgi:hypothetical protein